MGWFICFWIPGFSRDVTPLWKGIFVYGLASAAYTTGWPDPLPGIIESHQVFYVLAPAETAYHYRFPYRYATKPEQPTEERLRANVYKSLFFCRLVDLILTHDIVWVCNPNDDTK